MPSQTLTSTHLSGDLFVRRQDKWEVFEKAN